MQVIVHELVGDSGRQSAIEAARAELFAMFVTDDCIYSDKIRKPTKVLSGNPDISPVSSDLAVVDILNNLTGVRGIRNS